MSPLKGGQGRIGLRGLTKQREFAKLDGCPVGLAAGREPSGSGVNGCTPALGAGRRGSTPRTPIGEP